MTAVRITLSRRETALLLLLLLLILFLAGWRFFFSPLLKSAAVLHREHTALLLEQDQMQEQLQRGEELSSVREQWQSRAEALYTAVPSPERLPEVLARLEALLGASPVTLHTLQIGEIEPAEDCAVSRVRLRITGEAAALLRLLEQLEQFEHLLLFDQISWIRDEEELASLDLSFRLVFYPTPPNRRF